MSVLVIKNKKKFIRGISIIIIGLILIISVLWFMISNLIAIFTKNVEDTTKETSINNKVEEPVQAPSENSNTSKTDHTVTQVSTYVDTKQLEEWNLKLVNKDNAVDRSYVPELEEIDDGVKFDKRAVSYLKDMINAMYKDGISNIWVASAYRSYDKQEELFNNKVKQYKNEGKSQEEAERLTQKIIQRPEMSEHNLALAADFNKVDNDFEDTKAFTWLQKNASNYGFILRYPKDKQDITGISYESWHWRYVGKEHAKIMKEKGYCLEEYIEYLKGVQEV